MKTDKSGWLFREAKKYIPGGVNSPVRAFRSVQMDPLFIASGRGSRIFDADENEYIDYVGSWGPLILGHAHPKIIAAAGAAIAKGTSYGAPTELEVEMAKAVIKAVPSLEEVRMVSSGTEAVMSAIRLARGFTKRSKVLKFEGCYHGHSDSMLVKAGSGVTTLGLPDSPGVTEGAAKDTLNLSYNDLAAVEQTMAEQGDKIAAIIVEPVAGNMGVVPPQPGFLEGLRRLATEQGSLLIFDEVITGFRVAYGGAQQLYGIMPDLTCLGKIIGGGFPVGAFGGRREIMEYLAPAGPVYQAGTLSGNPVAMAAGLANLRLLAQPGVYDKLEKSSARLSDGIKEAAEKTGIACCATRVGSMSCLFFTPETVFDYQTARTSDTSKYSRYFKGMLKRGIYLAPSQFEAMFVSLAHSEDDIDNTVTAAEEALREVERMDC